MLVRCRLKNRPVEAQAAGTSRPTGGSEISQNWDELGRSLVRFSKRSEFWPLWPNISVHDGLCEPSSPPGSGHPLLAAAARADAASAADAPDGAYRIGLRLADAALELADDPRQAIRLSHDGDVERSDGIHWFEASRHPSPLARTGVPRVGGHSLKAKAVVCHTKTSRLPTHGRRSAHLDISGSR